MFEHILSSKGPRDGDSGATVFATMSAMVIIAHQVAGKATRDALFLTHYDVTDLPKAVILGAICSVLAVLLMSRLLTRRGPAVIVPAAYTLSGVLFLGQWYLLPLVPDLAALTLYLHISMLGAVLISGFWSVFNERFDPHSAKRIVTRIAAAATLGGLAGGLIAERVAAITDIRTMLLVLAAAHLFSAFSVMKVGRSGQALDVQRSDDTMNGLQALRKTPYLQQMALLMSLGAVVAALLDYALKVEAAARYDSSESLIAFFAIFYAISGVAAFLLQTTLGRRALKRLGLGKTIAIMPATVIVAGFIGVSLTNIWTVIVLRGAQTAIGNSLFRSGFELLYSPVARKKKRAAKSIIDVGAERVGDMLGGGLVLALLFLVPDLPNSLVIGLAIAVAGISLIVVSWLKQGYVAQLASSLRDGQIEINANALVNLSPPQYAATPLQVQFPAGEAGGDAVPVRNYPQSADLAADAEERKCAPSDSIVATIEELRSNDSKRMRGVFTSQQLNPILVPHIIPLLGYEELAHEAQRSLSRISAGIEGQLADALLHPGYLTPVHHRLVEVLEDLGSQRALNGLIAGLEAGQYEVRYSCAMGMYRLTARKPQLHISRKPVLATVERELENDRNWVLQPLGSAGASGRRVKSLEYIFRLLALVHDREVVNSCYQALLSENRTLYGTALEYLDNTLPQNIRDNIWPFIKGTVEVSKEPRDHQELVDKLLQLTRNLVLGQEDGVEFDIAELEKYTVISLHGEVDLAVAPVVGKQILEVLGHGKNLVVDLSQVSYIDSSGISSLVEGHQYAGNMGLEFALAGLGEGPMKVLQLCRLDGVFTIYDSVQFSAIDSSPVNGGG
jgi:anti-anti-sigma factor